MAGLQQKYNCPPRSTNDTSTEAPFYELYGSFLEIYNEEVIDLLAPVKQSTGRAGGRITIREDARGEISLTGIREEKVAGGEEVLMLLQKGSLCRTTKSTEMNMVSSRSHAIFTLQLRQRTEGSPVLCSKLHFVDLAGSERLKRTNARGDRARESISINSGLLALGNVIAALGDETRRATHVPYRDSKLTRLLQDSLGGNAQTLMIACASPSSDNFTESLNTLRYAARAKNIKNRLQLNEELGGSGAFEIGQLKKQIAALKAEILHLRTSRRGEAASSVSGTASSAAGAAAAMLHSSNRSVIDAIEGGGGGSELSRLRVQNAELKRRVAQLAREKATAEAERDFFKGAAGPASKTASASAASNQHLKLITDLKLRIAELEQQLSSASSSSSSSSQSSRPTGGSSTTFVNGQPQTPVWLRQANALIDKARSEITINVNVMKEIEKASLKMAAEAAVQDQNSPSAAGDGDDAMEVDADEGNNPFLDGKKPAAVSKGTTIGSSASVSSLSASQSHSSLASSATSGHILQFTQAQFAAAVATRTQALLSKLRSDLAIKEDLIRQFEVCQAEYNSMRRHYDEKIKLMHENLQRSQKERDLALSKQRATASNSNNSNNNTAGGNPNIIPPGIKAKYEDRIKLLGKELNELRAKLASANKALTTRSSASETAIKNLTKQLDLAKTERARLAARLADETARLRTDTFVQDSEIKELRQRERRAQEACVKLKKAYDFQKALLQRRIEQHHQSRQKIKQLLLALRKRQASLANVTFDSSSWRSSASDLDDDMEIDESANESVNEVSLIEDDVIGNEAVSAGSSSHGTAQTSNDNNETVYTSTQASSSSSSSDDDDIHVHLQLTAETEAILNSNNSNNNSNDNDNIEMMEIDPANSPSPAPLAKFNLSMSPSDLASNSTGELPRSALRHSPLIERAPRDGIVDDLLKAKRRKPFK